MVECGLSAKWVGIPLLVLSLFSMAGATLGEKMGRVNLRKLLFFGGLLTCLFISASGSSVLIVSVLAAGLAHGLEEMLMLRIENENQKMFSSEIRATMVSVSSMLYSVFMVVLSPVAGWIAKEYSIAAAFTGLGIFAAGMVCVFVLWERKE